MREVKIWYQVEWRVRHTCSITGQWINFGEFHTEGEARAEIRALWKDDDDEYRLVRVTEIREVIA